MKVSQVHIIKMIFTIPLFTWSYRAPLVHMVSSNAQFVIKNLYYYATFTSDSDVRRKQMLQTNVKRAHTDKYVQRPLKR